MASQTKATLGVVDSVSAVTGVVVSIDINEDNSMLPQMNEIGQTIQQCLYDHKRTASITVQVPNSAKVPDIGTQITVSGSHDFKGYITSVQKTENNTSYMRWQISAESYLRCAKVHEDNTGAQ